MVLGGTILGGTILWVMLWAFTSALVRDEERLINSREIKSTDYFFLFLLWWLIWVYKIADLVSFQWIKESRELKIRVGSK